MGKILGKQSFVYSSLIILQKEKRPIGPKEIIKKLLDLDLIKSNGKTPDDTLGASLNRLIKQGGIYKNKKYNLKKTNIGEFYLENANK
jgi:hypothetical protein